MGNGSLRFGKFFKLLAAVLFVELVGGIGSLFTAPSILGWYEGLRKSALTPPSWVFAPAWTTLYALIGISLYIVIHNNWKVTNPILQTTRTAWNRWSERLWRGDLQKENAIAVFSVQMILNVLWSYLFFGLHLPGVAFFEILALWMAIVYVIVNFYRISKVAGYLLVPYLVWVSFAAYLNFIVWIIN